MQNWKKKKKSQLSVNKAFIFRFENICYEGKYKLGKTQVGCDYFDWEAKFINELINLKHFPSS